MKINGAFTLCWKPEEAECNDEFEERETMDGSRIKIYKAKDGKVQGIEVRPPIIPIKK